MESKIDRKTCEHYLFNIRNGNNFYNKKTLDNMIEFYIKTEEYEKCAELIKAKKKIDKK